MRLGPVVATLDLDALFLGWRGGGVAIKVRATQGWAHGAERVAKMGRQGQLTDPGLSEVEHLRQQLQALQTGEAEYRAAETRYRMLFEQLGDAVVVADVETGTIVDCNRRAERLFGKSREQLVGIHQTELHPAEQRHETLRKFQHVADSDQLIDTEIVTQDRRVIPINVAASVVELDGRRLLVGVFRDVSAYRVVETALRESTRRAQQYLDLAGVMFVAIKADETVSLANRKACELLECTQEEILGHNWFTEFLPERLKENVRQVFQQLMAGEIEPVEYFENPVWTKSGQERMVAWHNTVVRDDTGRMLGTLSSGEDITERRRSEEYQRLAVRVLEVLNSPAVRIDAIREIVLSIKTATGYEAVGVRLRQGDDFPYYEANGFPAHFIEAERSLCVRSSTGELVRDERGRPVLACMCGNVISGRTDPSIPFFTQRGSFWTNNTTQLLASTTEEDRQGHTRNRCNGEGYESVALVPLRSEDEIVGLLQLNDRRKNMFTAEVIGFFEGLGASIGVALARTRAAGALRRSEKLHRSLISALPDGVVESDLQGNITFASPRAAEMHGYDAPEEIVSKNALELLAPECHERAVEGLQGIVQTGMARDVEYTCLKKDGSPFPMELSSALIRDDLGHPASLVSVTRDISDRKQAEQERARLEEQLVHGQKMEAIGTLAGGVAHDFNNLLTAILGQSNMLRLEAEPGSELFESAALIEQASARAAELTRQLLGFARKGKFQNVPVDMHQAIGNAVALLQRTVDKRIRMSVNLVAEDPSVLGDPSQLDQVLMNLAVNARDAMPEGGHLAFSTRNVEYDIGNCPPEHRVLPGRYLWISVSDTGTGMTEEVRQRVFDPFFTTKQRGEGTGLGLAMVYGIVRNHGGSICVHSTLDHGSTFEMLLPLGQRRDRQGKSERVAERTRGSGRLLVIDDEETVRQTIYVMLRPLGYEVMLAADGLEGVEIFKAYAHAIDLVILDLTMPVMAGRECYRLLKEINPDVTVVVTSGHALEREAQQVIDEGALLFVQKPFAQAELSEAVALALQERAVRPLSEAARASSRSGVPTAMDDAVRLREAFLGELAEIQRLLVELQAASKDSEQVQADIASMRGELADLQGKTDADPTTRDEWHDLANVVVAVQHYSSLLKSRMEAGGAPFTLAETVNTAAQRAIQVMQQWRTRAESTE